MLGLVITLLSVAAASIDEIGDEPVRGRGQVRLDSPQGRCSCVCAPAHVARPRAQWCGIPHLRALKPSRMGRGYRGLLMTTTCFHSHLSRSSLSFCPSASGKQTQTRSRSPRHCV